MTVRPASDFSCPNVRKASDLSELSVSDLSEMPIGIGRTDGIGQPGTQKEVEPMKQKLDHAAAASLLDRISCMAASLDLALSEGGCTSWGQDAPRAHSLAVLEHLGGLRRSLDLAAVAAGFPAVYVRRDLKPGPELLAQARAARLAALEAEEAMLEERRRRTWRGTPTPRL